MFPQTSHSAVVEIIPVILSTVLGSTVPERHGLDRVEKRAIKMMKERRGKAERDGTDQCEEEKKKFSQCPEDRMQRRRNKALSSADQ